MTSGVSFLLPLMIISRLRQRRRTAEYDVLSEFKIGRLTNTLLEEVLDVERGVIWAGGSLPMGSSVLIVAKK